MFALMFWLVVAAVLVVIVGVRVARRVGRLERYEGWREVWWELLCSWGWPRTANGLMGQLRRQAGQLIRQVSPGVVVAPDEVNVLLSERDFTLIESVGEYVADGLASVIVKSAASRSGDSRRATYDRGVVVNIATRLGVREGRPEFDCVFVRRITDADIARRTVRNTTRLAAQVIAATPSEPAVREPLAGTQRYKGTSTEQLVGTASPGWDLPHQKPADGGDPDAETPREVVDRGPVLTLVCSTGEVAHIGADWVVTGSSPEVDWVVNGSGVSRRHARFQRRGGMLVVEDLGSTNGVWLDGTRIGSGPHVIGGGSMVTFGAREAVSFTVLSGDSTTALLSAGPGADLGSGRGPWWARRDDTVEYGA